MIGMRQAPSQTPESGRGGEDENDQKDRTRGVLAEDDIMMISNIAEEFGNVKPADDCPCIVFI